MKGAAPQRFLPTNEEGDEESMSRCDGGGTMIFRKKVELLEPIASGATRADSEGHATGVVNRENAMNALEMEEWRKVRRKKK